MEWEEEPMLVCCLDLNIIPIEYTIVGVARGVAFGMAMGGAYAGVVRI